MLGRRDILFTCLLAPLIIGLATPAGAQTTPGWHDDQTIELDGQTRYYRYYVPEDLTEPAPPVVFFLHGGGGSMRRNMPPAQLGSAVWPAIADEHGFILVVPNGINRETGDASGNDQSWNDCRADGDSMVADDVQFLSSLVDWSVAELMADATRMYFTGSSNGGMMTYRMASEAPGKVAAAAAFIANSPTAEQCAAPQLPVPMMIVNGTEDPLMPYDGGTVIGFVGGGVRSTAATVDRWLAANGIEAPPEIDTLPDRDPADGSVIERLRHVNPATGMAVRLLRVVGGGHSMPTIARPLTDTAEALVGENNHDIEGAEAAWAFLSEFAAFPALSEGQWVAADPAFVDAGEGIAFDFSSRFGMLFAAWFTYTTSPVPPDDGGNPHDVGAADQRWLTAQLEVRGDRAVGPILSSSGGEFDAPGTGFRSNRQVGTMTVEFTACNRATVSYEIEQPDRSRSFKIMPLEERVSGETVCRVSDDIVDPVGGP